MYNSMVLLSKKRKISHAIIHIFSIQECETIIHTTPDPLTGDTEDSPELITVRSKVGEK